ncbi:plasmid mobilization relaxosome protein MobC [Streptomyces botrytidirepellens]|uniref:Plasmid mobilization relaxosome protein MobC n=1 Tax=Streptomyces botrytidirepellens TaxID=2486417 RepID=A0A3M8VMU6_9ACTN|nr:plasmid mobilization relaxosome protein MobC [Streptomyces botrytidirepellens]RNG17745.1 plasmid mobilization relaxosome protein MobC [Streptomyces botrytidirepellens]
MHDQHHEPTVDQEEMSTTATTSAARYGVGPSKGRSNADTSAPGVAKDLGHQGVPEEKQPADVSGQSPVARADDALHRVARRRAREDVQRKERVDVRYSVDEKDAIMARAREMEIAGAHLVGAVVMAYLEGDFHLPGQRTQFDDVIDELASLRAQIAAIGNNVNQIAFRLNSGGDPHPVDITVLTRAESTLNTVRVTIQDIAAVMNHAVSAKAA